MVWYSWQGVGRPLVSPDSAVTVIIPRSTSFTSARSLPYLHLPPTLYDRLASLPDRPVESCVWGTRENWAEVKWCDGRENWGWWWSGVRCGGGEEWSKGGISSNPQFSSSITSTFPSHVRLLRSKGSYSNRPPHRTPIFQAGALLSWLESNNPILNSLSTSFLPMSCSPFSPTIAHTQSLQSPWPSNSAI